MRKSEHNKIVNTISVIFAIMAFGLFSLGVAVGIAISRDRLESKPELDKRVYVCMKGGDEYEMPTWICDDYTLPENRYIYLADWFVKDCIGSYK